MAAINLGQYKVKETRKKSILKLIADLGGQGTRGQINEIIPNYWTLKDEEKQRERGVGKPRFWHLSASVCQSLKDLDGYLENPSYAVWKITEKGWQYLSSIGYNGSRKPSEQPQNPPTTRSSENWKLKQNVIECEIAVDKWAHEIAEVIKGDRNLADKQIEIDWCKAQFSKAMKEFVWAIRNWDRETKIFGFPDRYKRK